MAGGFSSRQLPEDVPWLTSTARQRRCNCGDQATAAITLAYRHSYRTEFCCDRCTDHIEHDPRAAHRVCQIVHAYGKAASAGTPTALE